jgi:hypothetical protein
MAPALGGVVKAVHVEAKEDLVACLPPRVQQLHTSSHNRHTLYSARTLGRRSDSDFG